MEEKPLPRNGQYKPTRPFYYFLAHKGMTPYLTRINIVKNEIKTDFLESAIRKGIISHNDITLRFSLDITAYKESFAITARAKNFDALFIACTPIVIVKDKNYQCYDQCYDSGNSPTICRDKWRRSSGRGWRRNSGREWRSKPYSCSESHQTLAQFTSSCINDFSCLTLRSTTSCKSANNYPPSPEPLWQYNTIQKQPAFSVMPILTSPAQHIWRPYDQWSTNE